MRFIRGLSLAAKVALLVVILGSVGAAAATGVVLPSHANSHAVTNTQNVTTGGSSAKPSDAGTPAPQASFGQCVAANAKTASTNHATDWNPTQGCTNPGNASSASDVGKTASANAGANGAAHANANGADAAAARGGNAETHP